MYILDVLLGCWLLGAHNFRLHTRSLSPTVAHTIAALVDGMGRCRPPCLWLVNKSANTSIHLNKLWPCVDCFSYRGVKFTGYLHTIVLLT